MLCCAHASTGRCASRRQPASARTPDVGIRGPSARPMFPGSRQLSSWRRTAAACVPGSADMPDASSGHQAEPAAPSASLVQQPLSTLDVDAELWQVLDLCSNEELEAIYNELHTVSLLSPVVKSLMTENEPPLLEQRGRPAVSGALQPSVMHKIEARFRFLAADSNSLLRGARPSYREALLAIRERLGVRCSSNLSTFDLETELFLHILQHCVEHVQLMAGQARSVKEGQPGQTWSNLVKPGPGDLGGAHEAAAVALQEGDGMSQQSEPSSSSSHEGGGAWGAWAQRFTAPIRFGLDELGPALVKLGSALTVSAVGRSSAQHLAAQLMVSHARYLAVARMACGAAAGGAAGVGASALGAVARGGGGAVASAWGRQAALEAAQKGLTVATARYSAVQGMLSFLGPVMWGWLAVDLALKSIGTDYARITRAVFILAQVRLVRTQGFTPPPASPPPPAPFL
ncbi:hypothetical protein QJQ45_000994 [Haematococcus lacustris]|nr:hypothetical protein QJQ45_000994 [Haematococcus lacustris]